MNLDSRLIICHPPTLTKRKKYQILKTERIWGTDKTDFWELHVSWRAWGYLKLHNLHFLAKRKISPTFLLSLPFGVKRHGHEEMVIIPQVQERPDSFVLSHSERRVKRHFASHLLFPHQEARQSTEGRRTCRTVLPSLPWVGLEEWGLHEKVWEMGEQKNWAGYQESNSSRREQEIWV